MKIAELLTIACFGIEAAERRAVNEKMLSLWYFMDRQLVVELRAVFPEIRWTLETVSAKSCGDLTFKWTLINTEAAVSGHTTKMGFVSI